MLKPTVSAVLLEVSRPDRTAFTVTFISIASISTLKTVLQISRAYAMSVFAINQSIYSIKISAATETTIQITIVLMFIKILLISHILILPRKSLLLHI